MIWHLLKFWTSFLLPVFYKRIQVKNMENLKLHGPAIIVMNHPNAFIDPVAISMTCYPPQLKYLARGDVFKPGLATWFFEKLGIVPIFRIQDGGKEGLKKNDEAYRRVNQLLKKNYKIIVFAEGLCVQERRLRPLKKGVARMIAGAYEYLGDEKLTVIPVGLNYSRPDKFRSNLLYNVGEPVLVKEFMQDYQQNPAKTLTKLLGYIEPKLKELITHIDNPKNDDAVYMAEQLFKKDWVKKQGLNYSNLHDQLTVLKQITNKINTASKENMDALEEFNLKARYYFSKLHQNGLRDWLINPQQNKFVNWPLLVVRYLLLIMGAPFYLIGLLGNYVPLYITNKLTKKIVKKPEFFASIALAISLFVFLLNYLLWSLGIYFYFESGFAFMMGTITLMLSGAFCLYYHPFLYKSLGMSRILNKKVLFRELTEEREKLIVLINKF
jgi:glycerol-3-phosphate O-acyltransferase / dihydroxyacetone phosphate acyltransferase